MNTYNTYKFFFSVLIAAFAAIFLPSVTQAQDGNRYSTTIGMVADYDGTGPTERTSHFGILEPLGLGPNQQVQITLNVPRDWEDYPVGIAPLDGGEIITASKDLHVESDGTIAFAFQGGETPGLYRVLVTVAGEQYELQLYIGARSPTAGASCP